MNFSKITDARKFAEYLEKTQNDVSVIASGNGKIAKCVIRKWKGYASRNINAEKAEVAKLVELRNRIVKTKREKKLTVVPPPKRPKLDTRASLV